MSHSKSVVGSGTRKDYGIVIEENSFVPTSKAPLPGYGKGKGKALLYVAAPKCV